jgi:hypothetical protein
VNVMMPKPRKAKNVSATLETAHRQVLLFSRCRFGCFGLVHPRCALLPAG